jgi:hypothetical protein
MALVWLITLIRSAEIKRARHKWKETCLACQYRLSLQLRHIFNYKLRLTRLINNKYFPSLGPGAADNSADYACIKALKRGNSTLQHHFSAVSNYCILWHFHMRTIKKVVKMIILPPLNSPHIWVCSPSRSSLAVVMHEKCKPARAMIIFSSARLREKYTPRVLKRLSQLA